jgi:hypothetical protein
MLKAQIGYCLTSLSNLAKKIRKKVMEVNQMMMDKRPDLHSRAWRETHLLINSQMQQAWAINKKEKLKLNGSKKNI